jgi:hypothetical protein
MKYVADVLQGHPASITMKMEAVCSSETLVTIGQTIGVTSNKTVIFSRKEE